MSDILGRLLRMSMLRHATTYDVLPNLTLGDSGNAERQKATGTDDQNLVRMLITKADKLRQDTH